MTTTQAYQFAVTDRLRRVIRLARPLDADEWLAGLPDQVAGYAADWRLRLTGLPDSGAMSCCVFAETQGGTPVVLKIPVDRASGVRESDILSPWSVRGVSPRVLLSDRGTGAFVMERVVPGVAAEPTGGMREVRDVTSLLRTLHATCPPAGPPLTPIDAAVAVRLDWAAERFISTRNPAGSALVEMARVLISILKEENVVPALLHGDFQPKNILRGDGGRLFAVDPFAHTGDPMSDYALWTVVQASSVPIGTRVEQLVEVAKLDGTRLRLWVALFAILELRPYALTYTPRMAEYLCGEGAALLRSCGLAHPADTVRRCMAVAAVP